MPTKLAACDPCRSSKLACDHALPVCARCHEKNRAGTCVYRARPFKRRQPARTQTRDASYHKKIFDHIPQDIEDELHHPSSHPRNHFHKQPEHSVNEADIAYGAKLVEKIQQCTNVLSCSRLVTAWISKEVNLALAGSLTKKSAQTMEHIFDGLNGETDEALHISRNLFLHSSRPLAIERTSTFDHFCASFCTESARWETIGLFFTAVARATIDLTSFGSLFTTEQQCLGLQKLATRFSDQCLDIALSLDCLNDLQLLLQYENFINHSFVDGDQSYHSWRRLGDVASSIFALGYHEHIDHNESAPSFVKDLRWAAFACAYSGDKNVSIFLGRPPRIQRKYCRLELPGNANGVPSSDTPSSLEHFRWSPDENFDYTADTRWSFLCALLKEEALDLFQEKNYEERVRRANAEVDWNALPPRFRLEGALKYCGRKAVERDFMASARLNHLHILFLLRLALVRRMAEPDSQLISISADILSLAVEIAVLKEHLSNSGTGIVAYYGLPAAGVLSLSLLNRSFIEQEVGVSVSKIVQDLSVLVAEV
ncbi:Quinic acid utilization activator [Hyphodiscus hymeniophilus]|uniref:Quinic acid utilization activator n=1 Tax=Hyphodiscus hymeniophilus TaxID=353542 RepID=A0A9P6SK17_9HELO|nr:Quinic acid utilization activator [Hyphodiscus hymeniophilus]